MSLQRRDFIALLGGAAAAWPLASNAQQGERMRRIGVLAHFSEGDPTAVRLFSAFEHKLSEHAKFWEGVEYLPQVDNFENYIVNAEVGVESSMTKKLSLQAVLQDSYRNDPTPGKLQNDLRLIAGVKYKF